MHNLKEIVQSTILYASDTCALPKQQLHRLDIFQSNHLEFCRKSMQDKIINGDILGWCDYAEMSAMGD